MHIRSKDSNDCNYQSMAWCNAQNVITSFSAISIFTAFDKTATITCIIFPLFVDKDFYSTFDSAT